MNHFEMDVKGLCPPKLRLINFCRGHGFRIGSIAELALALGLWLAFCAFSGRLYGQAPAQLSTNRVSFARAPIPARSVPIFPQYKLNAWVVNGWVRVALGPLIKQDLIVLSQNSSAGVHAPLALGEAALGMQFDKLPPPNNELIFSCTVGGTNIQAEWTSTNLVNLGEGGASLMKVKIPDALEIYSRLTSHPVISPAYEWEGELNFFSKQKEPAALANQLEGALKKAGVVFMLYKSGRHYAVPAALTSFVDWLEANPPEATSWVLQPGPIDQVLPWLSSRYVQDWIWSFEKLTSRRLQGAIPDRITAPATRGLAFAQMTNPILKLHPEPSSNGAGNGSASNVELSAVSALQGLTVPQAVDWLAKRSLLSGAEFQVKGDKSFSVTRSSRVFEHWNSWAEAHMTNDVSEILRMNFELLGVYTTQGRTKDRLALSLKMFRLEESRGVEVSGMLPTRVLSLADAYSAAGEFEEATLLIAEYLEPERLKDPRLEKFPESAGYWYGQRSYWKEALQAYRLVRQNPKYPLGHIYRAGAFTGCLMMTLNRDDLYPSHRKEMLNALVETATRSPNSDGMKEFFSNSYPQTMSLVTLLLATPIAKEELEALRMVTQTMLWERADQTNAVLYDYRSIPRLTIPKTPGEQTNAPPAQRKRRTWTKAGVHDVKAGIARGLFALRDGDLKAAAFELKRSADEVDGLPEGWVPLRTEIYSALAMTLKHSGNAEEALKWWNKAVESERGLLATVGTPKCAVWSDALLASILFKEARGLFEPPRAEPRK